MVDEMELLSGLKTAEPVRPHAFEEARTALRAAMAAEEMPETRTAARRRARWGTRRTAGFSVAALGAAAAAVALVVTSTSASAPSHSPAANGAPSSAAAAKGSPAAAAVNPILAQLAANITALPVKLPGNATLEIRNQSPTSKTVGGNGIDLYTDNGTYYWGYDKSNLIQAIAERQDDGQGAFKRAMAAALYAVKGDITTARARMAIANLVPGIKPKPADDPAIDKLKAIDKAKHIKYTPPKPLTPAQKKEQTDNLIWLNATDALEAAPGNPQVRAGVLRIMATMPNVKVTHTTTAGQPTLTVADSWPLLAGAGLVESLVINAGTGFPVAMFNTDPGQPLNATYFHTTRVTLAKVAAGKF
jgi:hypothetical protein